MSDDAEHVDFNLVPVRVEDAVSRLESCQNSAGQIKSESDGVGILKQAVRSAGIDAGDMLATRSANIAPDRRATGTAMLVSRPA